MRHLIHEREHAKCTCAVLGNALKINIRGSAAAWGSTLVGARGPGGDGYFGGKNFRSNLLRTTEPGVIAELDHAKSPFAILVNALETLNRWSAAASGRTSAGA